MLPPNDQPMNVEGKVRNERLKSRFSKYRLP